MQNTAIYLLTSQLALSKPMGQRHLYASPTGTQCPPLRQGRALHGCCRQSSTLTPVIASVTSPTTLSLIVSWNKPVGLSNKTAEVQAVAALGVQSLLRSPARCARSARKKVLRACYTGCIRNTRGQQLVCEPSIQASRRRVDVLKRAS